MNSDAPLVMALDDPGADAATTGGKGASLGRLARAGMRVPAGFCVTTQAYRDAVARGGVDAAVPEETAAAIAAAYAALGEQVAVAVRSSATAEDLVDLSFAGQHDSYLNVRGAAAVADAVRRCWASLGTARAVAYRAEHGVAADTVAMAVVVQRLVPAQAAGVLFTVNPVTGDNGQVVVNANWGLGESVVGGQATPDTVVIDRADGHIADYQVGGKEVTTVLSETGTRDEVTAAGRRGAAVLTAAQAAGLARTGVAIEDLYGQPMDVEWAWADDELFVLQARPITGRAAAGVPAGEEWNDALAGDYLWTNTNLGEAIPDVMTPATWSFLQLFMTRVISPPAVPPYYGYGRVGGRFYVNLSVTMTLGALGGLGTKRFLELTRPVFGQLPPGVRVPRASLPRLKIFAKLVRITIANTRRLTRARKRLPGFVASAPERCDRLRAAAERAGGAAELAELWRGAVQPLFVEASDVFSSAATLTDALVLVTAPGELAELIGRDDASSLMSGQQQGAGNLASLDLMTGLDQLAHGDIDRATFTRRYGHRGPHEVETSIPRPAEDPGWIDEQLAAAGAGPGVDELLARREAARQQVWTRLAGRPPKELARIRKLAGRWSAVERARESTRSELIRSMWVLRAWTLRAGELTGCGDDVFFLSYQEILGVLGGDRSSLSRVAARRAAYDVYRSLPAYPAVIRGRFDPVRWAADPDRRSDYYDARGGPDAASRDTITGFGGAAGVVEGVARVILRPEDAGQLEAGEILVAVSTNVGWTPVFPRAAAVVTDVGAPLSHAAIVARELGIPAVVGCGNATMRLHSGDRVRVDGGAGTVWVI
ncbi:MAG TPA: PEP/pyruvate-binding domain-containing protein [Streptosporangiaceae bacterium]